VSKERGKVTVSVKTCLECLRSGKNKDLVRALKKYKDDDVSEIEIVWYGHSARGAEKINAMIEPALDVVEKHGTVKLIDYGCNTGDAPYRGDDGKGNNANLDFVVGHNPLAPYAAGLSEKLDGKRVEITVNQNKMLGMYADGQAPFDTIIKA